MATNANFATKQHTFGVLTIDDILCCRGLSIRTLSSPALNQHNLFRSPLRKSLRIQIPIEESSMRKREKQVRRNAKIWSGQSPLDLQLLRIKSHNIGGRIEMVGFAL